MWVHPYPWVDGAGAGHGCPTVEGRPVLGRGGLVPWLWCVERLTPKLRSGPGRSRAPASTEDTWRTRRRRDRKSTRLNSSHVANSYAVFCLEYITPLKEASYVGQQTYEML